MPRRRTSSSPSSEPPAPRSLERPSRAQCKGNAERQGLGVAGSGQPDAPQESVEAGVSAQRIERLIDAEVGKKASALRDRPVEMGEGFVAFAQPGVHHGEVPGRYVALLTGLM